MKTTIEILEDSGLIDKGSKVVATNTQAMSKAMNEYAGQLAEPLQSAIKLLEMLGCGDQLLKEVKQPFNDYMINILNTKNGKDSIN
jgi:hypothetical protein